MTDWGAHHFGGATFAVDVRELQPVEVVYHDDKDGKYLTYRFPTACCCTTTTPGMGNLQVVGTPGEKRPAEARADLQGPGRHLRRLPRTASRPARSRSATSSWPSTPWPSATWASSPTS